jgi:DNA-binding transcriptional ArsR family regulator
MDSEWKVLYDRLVPIKCSYDERTKSYRGKSKVLGRIAGQLLNVIYALLKKDYDMLAALPEGAEPPEPLLYSREVHRRHLLGKQVEKDQPLPERDLSAPERVRQLLMQNPDLTVKDLTEMAGCARSLASRTRKKWRKEHPSDTDPTTTPERQRIIDALLQYGPMNLGTLAERISKNSLTTRNHLVVLRKEGRVVLGEGNIYKLVTTSE